MSDYIEREAAISAMLRRYWDGKETLREIMASVPAADVAPVVHARWDKLSGYAGCVIVCSACGNGALVGYSVFRPDGCLYTDTSGSAPYCPHCGAQLDAEAP